MGRRYPAALAVWSLGLILAACAGPAPRHHRAPPRPLREVQPSAASLMTGPSCLAELDRHDVSYRSVPPPNDPHPCGIDTPVRVESFDTARLNRPVLMGCGIADTVGRWEREVVEPAARQYLGQTVTGMVTYGAYNCRPEIGSGRNYVSMHSYGFAVDVAGWSLADGEPVTLSRDWSAGGRKAEFLRAVARGGCRYFSVVLTPEVNAAHHDHIHLDIGPYRFCGGGKE